MNMSLSFTSKEFERCDIWEIFISAGHWRRQNDNWRANIHIFVFCLINFTVYELPPPPPQLLFCPTNSPPLHENRCAERP